MFTNYIGFFYYRNQKNKKNTTNYQSDNAKHYDVAPTFSPNTDEVCENCPVVTNSYTTISQI